MKHLSILVAVCFFSSLLFAQRTTSFHGTAEGARAFATINASKISVIVARGFLASNPATFMEIVSFTRNSDGSVVFVFGFGTVPDQAYTNSGMEQMDLNVDTSQISTFQSTQCTFTFTPFFTSSCGPGPSGVIQVHWTNNKITTQRVLVDRRRTFPNSVTIREHQDMDQSSADASGSFLGLSFSSASQAQVQLNRDTFITITQ